LTEASHVKGLIQSLDNGQRRRTAERKDLVSVKKELHVEPLVVEELAHSAWINRRGGKMALPFISLRPMTR
jgi:hypothetical protein